MVAAIMNHLHMKIRLAAASGATRVLRGGAWVYSDTFLRTTDRYYDLSGYVGNNIGFRCVNDTVEP